MTSLKTAAVILVLAAIVSAQKIPPGTALPVRLSSDINVKKIQPGQAILATIAQNVPLPAGAMIRVGSHVEGRVLQAGANADGTSSLRMKFDVLRGDRHELPISTSLRALAGPVEVQNAGLPIHSPVAAETQSTWTTVQVGGDDVYRGGGHVVHGEREVGEPVAGGVMTELASIPVPGCEKDSAGRRLALWIFSSTACGAYGFGKLSIEKAGDTDPIGEIVLRGKKNIHLRQGSALLLIVGEGPQPQIKDQSHN